MSLDFTSGGGGPQLKGISVVDGRFVASFDDGSSRDAGPFPALDGTSIDAVVAANRDAIEALFREDMTGDERDAALAALVASIQATVTADHERIGALEAQSDRTFGNPNGFVF